MTGNRAENSMDDIRACFKARSLLCLKPVNIHREVCDIYGVGGEQMSHMSVCRWVAKIKVGQQDLKDAGRSTTIKSNIKKIKN